MKKLADRFGDVNVGAAAHAQLNSASKKTDESVDDWADRVKELASKAFKTCQMVSAVNKQYSGSVKACIMVMLDILYF